MQQVMYLIRLHTKTNVSSFADSICHDAAFLWANILPYHFRQLSYAQMQFLRHQDESAQASLVTMTCLLQI